VSPTLKAEVSRLTIVSGTEQIDAGGRGQVETPPIIPTGTGKGNLYSVVQVSGEPVGKDSILRELDQIIAAEYSRVPGGVTNGLRQAIRAANDLLYLRNTESLPLWQRVGEACCAVLRGDDLYMGIAGEAQIYVLQRGELRLFPPTATDTLTDTFAAESQHFPPLGVDQFLANVGLFHHRIEEGDIIILSSSGLSQIANLDQVTSAADGGLWVITDTLSSLASHTDLSALLIEIQAGSVEAIPRAKPARAGVRITHPQAKPSRKPARKRRSIMPPVKGVAAGLVALVLAFAARVLGFFASLARGVQVFFSWLFSSGLLGKLADWLRSGLVGLLQGLGILTQRMLPESEQAILGHEIPQVHTRRRVAEDQPSSRLPLVGALVIVAIFAGVSVSVVMRNHSRNTEFSQLLQESQSEMQLAQTSETPAGSRRLLENAVGYVEQALVLKSDDADAIALKDEILLALDEVNRVERLEFSAQIPLAGPPSAPHRVLLHENNVYVIDQGVQELHGYLLDEAGGIREAAGGALLLTSGSKPGGLAVQELTDVAWVEPGSGRETGNLLLLVNGGTLLQLSDPQGFAPVSVADSEIWSDPCRIDGFAGYLYVLDAQEDRILKYAPTGDSYDSFPITYFQTETVVDLEGAADMAIDGYIYVLVGQNILKFSGGLQEEFSLSGLEGQELENPVALFTSPDSQHIYVADAGAGRIVQLTKEGAFVQQFRPPRGSEDLFQGLRDISVDEAAGHLVALASEGLFVAPIEQPPAVIQ
jgi:hypothetical protein